MTTEATMKTGDVGRVLESVLRYGDGTPIDLTGRTIEFRWRPSTATYATLILPGEPADDPTTGLARVSGFQAGDVDEAGTYVCEWVLDVDTANEVTVPTDGYLTARIIAGIEPAP